MDVSIIIPNYNGLNLLQKNLPRLTKIVKVRDIIIVDDASTDGSCEYLKSRYPEILLLEKATNSGFAVTVNLGVKAARGEIIFLLNTDALPNSDFLDFVLPHFKDEKVFAVGCLDESAEEGKTVERGRGIGRWEKGLFLHSRGEVDRQNTLWASGGSSAFRKKYWEELGGMDTFFSPFYWEDIDLSYRALKRGWKIVFEARSKVRHDHEEGSIRSHFAETMIREIAYRNQFLFIWKNITDISLLVTHLLYLPYHFITALGRGDLALIKGFFLALLKLPQLLTKRKVEKPYLRLSDREVLASFSS